VNDVVEGYVSTQLIDSPDIEGNWNELTDGGHIIKTHRQEGEWLMGLGLAVNKSRTNRGIGRLLVMNVAEYIIKNRKKGIVLVVRLSDYISYKETHSPQEYAKLMKNGKPVDRCLKFFHHFGFKAAVTPKIMEDYVPGGGDPNSCGHSVCLIRKNPYFFLPSFMAVGLSKIVAKVIQFEQWRLGLL
jgi:hypothetical protein